MRDWNALKTKSDILVSWISLVGVIAAVLFGVSEYRENRLKKIGDTERATLEFISRYNQEGILAARSKIQQSFDTLGSSLKNNLEGINSLEAINQISAQFYKLNTANQLRSDATYNDAMLLVRFFDELLICIDIGLCDRPSAEKFFTDEAYQYHLMLKTEIDRIQLTRASFGLGLEKLRVSAAPN